MAHPFTRYVVLLERTPRAGERSEELLRARVGYLKTLEETGRLVLAGTFIGNGGGMVILDVETAEQAAALAAQDPLVVSGDSTCEVRRWLLSCRENDHLGMG